MSTPASPKSFPFIAGHRKLIMFLSALAVITFVPLSATNADVFETLIMVAIGANSLEHLGGALREKLGAGRPSGDRGGARRGSGKG